MFGGFRGPTADQNELDRLETMRMKAEPGTEKYDKICAAIKDLQASMEKKKLLRRRMTPEGRGTIGKILAALVPGVALTGLNYYLENHEGMLTGRRSKDQDTIMGSILRNLFRSGK